MIMYYNSAVSSCTQLNILKMEGRHLVLEVRSRTTQTIYLDPTLGFFEMVFITYTYSIFISIPRVLITSLK